MSALEESRQPGVPITKLLIKSRADFEGRATRRVRAAVERSIKKAQFTLRSDAIIFEKSLLDLLNAEMDIKLLAVSELGRLGSLHAGPVLKEALSMNSPELQAEIINALIQIEDKEVFALCKRFFKHDYAGVRTACIRGLYKAGQSESVPLLIEALKDENVEARNSAAIFLGWLEAKPAVPALLQTAAGEDLRVRKSSIMSLANIRDDGSVLPLIRFLNEDSREIRDMIIGALEKITGETLEFESDGADKQDRLESIERLKEWWIKKKYEMPDGYGAAAQAPGEQNADAREGEEATQAGALSKDPETH